MELYAEAQTLGLVVFFHGGRAGIEPESSHRYALPRHYEAALAEFPNLQFILGHAGARDSKAMIALAARYDNAWLGYSWAKPDHAGGHDSKYRCRSLAVWHRLAVLSSRRLAGEGTHHHRHTRAKEPFGKRFCATMRSVCSPDYGISNKTFGALFGHLGV